ncbi:D-beta-hydroxybutyrate dehydrogenase, mitochondrial-like [Penaeus chinensis]|uniref:D-beta-hydroxybutyrate dehydrogenase, mitochondrial-like n=1 Tax=Penaeus chinensis TaxID=139456 RepID=UPI001FB749F2|nr:D-beta-hydroxybutyrate dehydrogenase, mitochondrial-like [Penaeus chinensis]
MLWTSDKINFEHAHQKLCKTIPSTKIVWGIVNNASIAFVGAVEWVPLENFKTNADVNYLTCFCNEDFLASYPKVESSYGATQSAVEGFSDRLRLEMKKSGLKVSLIESSSYTRATQLLTKKVSRQADEYWEGSSEEVRSAYGEKTFRRAYEGYINHGVSLKVH